MPSNDPQSPLRSGIDPSSDLAPLVEMYIDELPPRIAALESAVNGNDPQTVRKLAHQLRGSGTSYGFPLITDLAGQLEEAITQGRPWQDAAALLLSTLRRITR